MLFKTKSCGAFFCDLLPQQRSNFPPETVLNECKTVASSVWKTFLAESSLSDAETL